MMLGDMKKARREACEKAEAIVRAAESENRQLTKAECDDFDASMATVNRLDPEIKTIEAKNTILRLKPTELMGAAHNTNSVNEDLLNNGPFIKPGPKSFTHEYATAFHTWIKSGGHNVSAALYEGSNPGGGYTVPIFVDNQIVPLAPPELGVRTVARVIPTASDMKIPFGASFGTVAAKAESGASQNFFAETDPTLGQFTLSAFMAGGVRTLSFEILQDVSAFQQFAVSDLVLAQQIFEEGLYVSGSGSGQAQGLLGNVGAGVTGVVADSNGNLLPISATFDVMNTLKAAYYPNATWLMARATGIAIQKAQSELNLFTPVWTRENGKDYLHGFPVTYSSSMPAIAAGATPVLFGDFQSGYIIGDRGGSGINVKILDQPLATAGQVQLLAYRRTDGRVRRSEAIQGITLHV